MEILRNIILFFKEATMLLSTPSFDERQIQDLTWLPEQKKQLQKTDWK